MPRRQVNLLLALTRHSSLTRREYQQLAGVSHTTAQQDLAALAAAGLILRVGSARGSRYALATELELTRQPPAFPQLSNNNRALLAQITLADAVPK